VNIPLVDLVAQFEEVREEVSAGLDDVMSRGAFIGGAEVGAFETAYAALSGSAHCVGVANGTDALELALRAVGVGPGDEVVLPANTFIATAEAAARIGAVPVLVDVDPDTLLIDPKQVGAAIGSRTKALVPVHLFGQVAPVEELAELAELNGIPIVEDAAQSQGATRHGRPAGSLGTIAATSFYPGKNLGAAGDAGAVTTDDPALARFVRVMSSHGSERKYDHEMVGFNSRLDTVQAVVLSAKLRRLAAWNEQRRVAAQRYLELLADAPGVVLPTTAEGNEHVWHLFVVRVAERDRVLKSLNDNGIGAGIHYPTPVHLTRAFEHLDYPASSFPVTETAAGQLLSLPIYPHITVDQQVRVVESLRSALR
jgi:dTDP-4-amino-4,6-dideoxygalactose transaminase